MRVLFLCHRFPFPPHVGGKVRSFHVIRHLHERGHEVVVASLARANDEGDRCDGIAPFCAKHIAIRASEPLSWARAALRLLTPSPSSMGYFHSPALARAVRQELASRAFDLLFVHCSSVAPYVAGAAGPRRILDFADMDSQKWLEYARWRAFPLSLGYRLEGRKLLAAEKALAARFDVCTVTTRAERATLDSYGAARRSDWFPNGVDAEYFAPAAEAHEPDTIAFIGKMDYFPNAQCMVDFCRDVLPLVRQRRPRARLRIVGANPPARVRALAAIPGVEVTGSVPDVRPFVRSAALAVAPLKIARGTQNKILEAMAMGVPTVASGVAAGGVDAEPGVHFLVASDPPSTADAILRLLEDPAERARFAERGRARMLSHHSWERALRELDRILASLFADRGGAAGDQPRRGATRAARNR